MMILILHVVLTTRIHLTLLLDVALRLEVPVQSSSVSVPMTSRTHYLFFMIILILFVDLE